MERVADISLIFICCLVVLLGADAGTPFAAGALPSAWAVSSALCAIIMTAASEVAPAPWRSCVPIVYCVLTLIVPSSEALLPLAAYELARGVHDGPRWWMASTAAPLALVAHVVHGADQPVAWGVTAMLMALALLLSLRTNRLHAQRVLTNRMRDDLQQRVIDLRIEQEELSEHLRTTALPRDPRADEPAARPAAFLGLTEREYEVARLIADGLDNHEIASLAYISEGTVRNRVSSILTKMGLSNRTQIAVAWWRGR
ncbi:helix-turn-helix transcriptional regulator [Collinsella vaginalis]|uniref:helix-turn-helix transcriptional regulator n=1 Tax=Collinsella vaginalis TaxID=1870987 RepID=UPI002481A0A5|nr:LuxR C-terminal-related transcriptional regulator [Collinsella vaginalis]